MIYTESFCVRWHDTDAKRELKPSEALAYMQETANLQFRTHARTLDEIRDRDGVGFILSRIAIDFLSPVYAHECIEVETATCQGHGLTFPRRFEMKRGGCVVARAMSQWALLRVSDRSLLKVHHAPLCFGDEEPLVTGMPLRFTMPRQLSMEQVGCRRIVYSDLDYNMHMNNTKYPNMVCDFLPNANEMRITGLSLSYCREATFGDVLSIERCTDGNGTWYVRANKEGEVCFEAMVRTA